MTAYLIGFIVFKLLLTAIFILGFFKLAVHIRNKWRTGQNHRENRGIIILKERLASGEIDEAKFRTMSEVLKN